MTPDDRKYAATHEWVKIEDDLAVVCITDHAQHELGDITFVELPELGDSVEAKGEVAVVESVKAASDIFTPVTGVVVEYDSDGSWDDTLTEIDFTAGDGALLPGNDVAMPAPTVVAAADLVDAGTAEQYEGVLVRIENVTVDNPDLGYGEWSVTGGAVVDDQLFEYVPNAGESFASITGVLNYGYGAYKIEPRDASDLVAAR